MKLCTICKIQKDPADFHRNKSSKDGLDYRCKVCKSAQDKKYYHSDQERKERIISHVKAYQAGPGREKANITKSSWHCRHAKKRRAHNEVRKALNRGELHRGSCERCGSEKVVGHHDDYDRPLEVRWLCEKHHKEWHLINGEALNPD